MRYVYLITTTDGEASWTPGPLGNNTDRVSAVWEKIRRDQPLTCSNVRPTSEAALNHFDGVEVSFNARHVISVARFPVFR